MNINICDETVADKNGNKKAKVCPILKQLKAFNIIQTALKAPRTRDVPRRANRESEFVNRQVRKPCVQAKDMGTVMEGGNENIINSKIVA